MIRCVLSLLFRFIHDFRGGPTGGTWTVLIVATTACHHHGDYRENETSADFNWNFHVPIPKFDKANRNAPIVELTMGALNEQRLLVNVECSCDRIVCTVNSRGPKCADTVAAAVAGN